VSLIKGDSRRKNIFDALVAIDDQIRPRAQDQGVRLRQDQWCRSRWAAARFHPTRCPGRHFRLPRPPLQRSRVRRRFRGSSGQQTASKFGWDKVFADYKSLNPKFEVTNENQTRYGLLYGIDYDLHVIPIRLGARFVDPDAFFISAAVLKTHNMVVATMAVKNMVMGAPLAPALGNNNYADSEKRSFTWASARATTTCSRRQKMLPPTGESASWTATRAWRATAHVGHAGGHRIALASTDFLAVDRVGLACMEIDASWPGYLNYAYQAGLGQYDLNKIDVVGAKIADVQKKYRLHADTDRMLEWRGPMQDLPPTWAATVVPGRVSRLKKGQTHLWHRRTMFPAAMY